MLIYFLSDIGTREVYMYNYLSVGVDALVTLNFHRARQSPFYIFSNRSINKVKNQSRAREGRISRKKEGKKECGIYGCLWNELINQVEVSLLKGS